MCNIMKKTYKVIIANICFVLIVTLIFNIGFMYGKLQKPKQNDISVQAMNNNTLLMKKKSLSELNLNAESIFYVSSDVFDVDNGIINKIGINFISSKQNHKLFMVEVCDSVNKECIKSDWIDRDSIKDNVDID